MNWLDLCLVFRGAHSGNTMLFRWWPQSLSWEIKVHVWKEWNVRVGLKLPNNIEGNLFWKVFALSQVSPLEGNIVQMESLRRFIVHIRTVLKERMRVQNWDINAFVNQMSNFLLRKWLHHLRQMHPFDFGMCLGSKRLLEQTSSFSHESALWITSPNSTCAWTPVSKNELFFPLFFF